MSQKRARWLIGMEAGPPLMLHLIASWSIWASSHSPVMGVFTEALSGRPDLYHLLRPSPTGYNKDAAIA